MIEPIFIGSFSNSNQVFDWAKGYGKTGLYYAEFTHIGPYNKNESNWVYFWLNDSVPYFGVWIFPHKKLSMVSLNSIHLDSNIPYEKGQLLYTSVEKFCNHTINISHPASEWLLFNQDLWNPAV